MNAYVYAVMANISFAIGTQFFTHFSRKFSSAWMNAYKAVIATICFGIYISIAESWALPGNLSLSLFLISGFFALGMGDVFLINSFAIMGAGRTLILFGFQPLILGILSYFILGQTISPNKLWAILFMFLCLFTFSYEGLKKSGHWEVRGIIQAALGVLFDAIGIIVTRYAFDAAPEITSFAGNFYRCLGAVFFFICLSFVKPFSFRASFNSLSGKVKLFSLLGPIFGTFLSLSFYLKAIQTSHLASISSIAITGIVFTSIFESILEKKWPSKYLVIAFAFFIIGFIILNK